MLMGSSHFDAMMSSQRTVSSPAPAAETFSVAGGSDIRLAFVSANDGDIVFIDDVVMSVKGAKATNRPPLPDAGGKSTIAAADSKGS